MRTAQCCCCIRGVFESAQQGQAEERTTRAACGRVRRLRLTTAERCLSWVASRAHAPWVRALAPSPGARAALCWLLAGYRGWLRWLFVLLADMAMRLRARRAEAGSGALGGRRAYAERGGALVAHRRRACAGRPPRACAQAACLTRAGWQQQRARPEPERRPQARRARTFLKPQAADWCTTGENDCTSTMTSTKLPRD